MRRSVRVSRNCDAAKLQALRAAAAAGFAEIEQGRYREVDEVGFDALIAEIGRTASAMDLDRHVPADFGDA